MSSRHVSLVLIPVDEITNQVITDNCIKPFIVYEREPVWKPGFYVYVDLKQEEFSLHIESRLYQKQKLAVHCPGSQTLIKRIRLIPSMSSPIPEKFTILRGTGKPGEIIRAVNEQGVQQFRLQKDYVPDGLLSIAHSEWLDFSGKKVMIKTGSENIMATLGECQEAQEFSYPVTIDDKKLDKKLTRRETSIIPVFETRVCEDGSFYLPVPFGEMQESTISLWYQGKEWKTKITNTMENKITLGELEGGC